MHAGACLVSAFWEWGYLDLPAYGPRRGCAGRSVRPIVINKAFKTLARGQASRGGRHKTSSREASLGWVARSGEIKARGTSRGSHDVSHDDKVLVLFPQNEGGKGSQNGQI